MEDDDRLARIEERLARLEREGESTPATLDTDGDERFWALGRLKELLPEPGGLLFTGSVTFGESEHYEWQEARLLGDLMERDWSEFAASLTALAHPVRLTLLLDVLTGRRTAAELSADERFGTSGQLYHHLRQLVAAGWLKSTGRGQYAMPQQRVIPLLVIVLGADR